MACAEKITTGITGYEFAVVIENMKFRIDNSFYLKSTVDNSVIVCN